jgi:hypothetical protein
MFKFGGGAQFFLAENHNLDGTPPRLTKTPIKGLVIICININTLFFACIVLNHIFCVFFLEE